MLGVRRPGRADDFTLWILRMLPILPDAARLADPEYCGHSRDSPDPGLTLWPQSTRLKVQQVKEGSKMSNHDEYVALIESPLSREQRACLISAEENADLSAHEMGFETQSNRWYQYVLLGYESLLESGIYA